MQLIGFKELQISCIIGLYDEERTREQPLIIDLEVQTEDFIDYVALASLVMQVAKEGRFALIETLAKECARALKKRWPEIASLEICVKKPQAIQGALYAYTKLQL